MERFRLRRVVLPLISRMCAALCSMRRVTSMFPTIANFAWMPVLEGGFAPLKITACYYK